MSEYSPIGDESRRKAHEEARVIGAKQGQPKEKPEIHTLNGAKDAFWRFNNSVVRPIPQDLTGQSFDTPNPDFFPLSTNESGVASIQNLSLEEALGKTQVLLPSPEPGIPQRLRAEIAQQQIRHDPETGQGLNSVFLNREALTKHPNNAVSVYSGLYLNVIGEKDESQQRLLELAKRMPNRALISFDYPGMGASDHMTEEQKDTSKQTGYFAVADAQLRILQDMGITKINVFGISQGGYASLALADRANEFGITVENAIIIGTPGVGHTPLPIIGAREGLAFTQLDVHHSSPADPEMWEATHAEHPDEPNLVAELMRKDPWARYARMMTKDTVYERARKALIEHPGLRILFVSGSEDSISPLKKLNTVISKLKAEFDGISRARVNQVIKPGEGHLAEVHPKELASIVKSQLEGTFL
ncbi:MAG: alpha/beta hydrolase [Candidatus Levyibacteriota bacterium]